MKIIIVVATAVMLLVPNAFAQRACAPLTGVVRDGTQALIPGATVTLDGRQHAVSRSDGEFGFACVAAGRHKLSIKAGGFSEQNVLLNAPLAAPAAVILRPEAVVTDVDVTASDDPTIAPTVTASGPSQTISGSHLQSLADDPDDLLKQLQQFSAAAGGLASGATVAVDGFENGEGGTHLPPKASIAYIKVNPDLFSAEYRNPPFSGGRIEVYTKPGPPTYHGTLFGTNSSSWMNARDPFSTASTPLGKQRYGLELTGPIRKQGSDFFTALEHRSINDDAVVNAIMVNASGQQTPLLQTVAAPQSLWIGNAKVDWQLGAKNNFIASVETYNNHLTNAGVGGVFLSDNGYAVSRYDTNIHITDVTTISPKIMHEGRIGLELDGFSNTPNSTAPQVQVPGAFTSGGRSQGDSHEDEMWVSIIDDAIIQTKDHLIKVGIQPEFLRITQHFPTNFSGTYVFGGGVTSTGATLTGIQQYANALNGAANGSPTTFSNVTGNPDLEVFELRNAVYYQDDWKALPNLHFAYGLRYYTQNDPTNGTGFQPRLGAAWSPDKKQTWNLHAHAGLFSGRNGAHNWAQIVFSDGTNRITNTLYNPTCSTTGVFTPGTCAPLNSTSASTPVHTIRTVQPNMPNLFYSTYNVGFTKAFLRGFSFSADYYIGEMWHYQRTENINSPTNGQPTGPRPYGANLNILQMQGTGRGYSTCSSSGLAIKR